MVKGRWREFCREPSALVFVVTMPVLWMLLLGYAFSGAKIQKHSIGLIKPHGETSELGKELDIILQDREWLKVYRGSEQELLAQMKKGEPILLISSEGSDPKLLTYKFDSSHPQALDTRRFVNDLIQSSLGRKDVLTTSDAPFLVQGSPRYIDFLIPGLLALSLFTTSLFGTGMVLVVSRRENLLKRYKTTPMRTLDYILSHIIGRFLIFIVEFCVICLAGSLLFNFKIEGAFFSYFGLALLGTATFTSLGLFLASRTANASLYSGLVNLLTLPMMLLSGVWFSRANFPSFLSHLADYLPLTALVEGLRRIALEGADLSSLGWEVSVLSVYFLVSTISTRLLFKWY